MNKTLLSILPLAFVLNSCGPLDESSAGGVNPLGSPGQMAGADPAASSGLQPGQFVRPMIDASFYKTPPDANTVAQKILLAGAYVKIIADRGTYSQVELDSGEIGYVMSAVLERPTTVRQMDVNPPDVTPLPQEPVPSLGY